MPVIAGRDLLFSVVAPAKVGSEMGKYENTMTIRGRVSQGLGESCFFTGLPWVRQQFIGRLGIDPQPGTFNLEIVDAEGVEKLKKIKRRKGVEIVPAESEFCSARCFHALIGGRVKGVLVIPEVPGYPECKLEFISADRIRDVLSLKVGDVVTAEIYLY